MLATVTPSGSPRRLFAAAGRFVSARLRGLGINRVCADWQLRAATCEQCPLRVVSCGISYCGTPFLQQIDRDEAVDGCGCPCHDKARSPGEHCPIDEHHHPAAVLDGSCNCRWCRAVAAAG